MIGRNQPPLPDGTKVRLVYIVCKLVFSAASYSFEFTVIKLNLCFLALKIGVEKRRAENGEIGTYDRERTFEDHFYSFSSVG